MCIALPTETRDDAKRSRLPVFLQVAPGGPILLGVLLPGLLSDRLRSRSHRILRRVRESRHDRRRASPT
jgi:hypothetical protein